MTPLDDLWSWAYEAGRESEPDAPSKLHHLDTFPPESSPPRWRLRGTTSSIGSPPFTRPFSRYLDDERRLTPIREALLSMRPKTREPWSLDLRIAWAVVEGGYDSPTALAPVLGMREAAVRPVAFRVLAYLREKADRIRVERAQVEDQVAKVRRRFSGSSSV